jgi:hypothetical protein
MEPDRHVRRTGSDYAEAFLSLLPQGQAWPKHAPGSILVQTSEGLCEYGGTVAAAPPICSNVKATHASPSSCCPTGNATGACLIPAIPRR